MSPVAVADARLTIMDAPPTADLLKSAAKITQCVRRIPVV